MSNNNANTITKTTITQVNLRYLYRLEAEGVEKVNGWCRENGWIVTKLKCSKCNRNMKLKPDKVSDGFVWECRYRGADNPHSVKNSIRKGSWFANSKLPISTILLLTYYWCKQTPNKMIEEELSLGSNTVVGWKNFCREVCMDICVKESSALGEEAVAKMVESKSGKKKCKRGARTEGNLAEEMWRSMHASRENIFMEFMKRMTEIYVPGVD